MRVTFLPSILVGLGSAEFNFIGQKIASSYLMMEQKIASATFFSSDFGKACFY